MKVWSKEYYAKNRAKILKKTSEYNKTHPEVRKKSQDKNRYKNILRARKDRAELKPHYVKTLARVSSRVKTEGEVETSVIVHRIKSKITLVSDDKVCNNCQELLPKSSFRTHGKKKNGTAIYSANCNKCYSVLRKRYKLNKEKQKATNIRYYWRNRERIRAKQNLYNAKNKKHGKKNR